MVNHNVTILFDVFMLVACALGAVAGWIGREVYWRVRKR